MNNLIEALTILQNHIIHCYRDRPVMCRNGALIIQAEPNDVSEENRSRLQDLGFEEGDGSFVTYRVGGL